MSFRSLLGMAVGFVCMPCMTAIVQAQVTPDGSLNTTVTQSGLNYTITNGTSAGTNLYHSLQQFSVPTGGSATFNLNNTPNITTIFSRVTGGNVSNIDGLIRTINSSNPVSLFLINPAGILFGPNASLNIGGSFMATTANTVIFADGVKFNATETTTPALLTISVPIGLQMGSNPGSITVKGSGHRLNGGNFMPLDRSQNPTGLQVGAGNTLALIGGAVNFAGGIAAVAGGGHLEVGSVSEGQVGLIPTQSGWVGDYSAVQQFNDIHLAQQSLLDASGSNGSIQIQGRNISLTEGSAVVNQNLGTQASGGITVRATASLNLTGNTQNGKLGSLIQIDNLGMSPTGDITISAAQLFLQNGGQIGSQTFTQASGSNITVKVAGLTTVIGFAPAAPSIVSSLFTVTARNAKAGDLMVSTGSLKLDGGSSYSLTAGSGQAGNLKIDAQDSIEIAGNNPITLSPTALTSSTISSGNAGNTFVNTSRLVIRDGGLLGASTIATGSAGNVTINASESVTLQGRASNSILPSRIASAAEMVDPAARATFGLPALPSGNAGSLIVNTPSLNITDGAYISVKNDGPGSAGDVQINANSLSLINQGSIIASTVSGNGGNIRLNLQEVLLMRHGSFLSATTTGTGDGGNITIDAPIIAGFENSDMIANAVKGRGGNIQITTKGIFGLKFRPQLTPGNDITASSQFGVSGNVQINTLSIDPTSGVVQLPVDLADPSQAIATGCNAQGSRFVATGRGGLPANPTEQVENDRPWTDIRNVSTSQQPGKPLAQLPTPNAHPPIIEASTFIRTSNGEVELIAQPASGNTELGYAPVTCAAARAISNR